MSELALVSQPPSEWRRLVGYTKFRLYTKWTCSRLRNQHAVVLRLLRGIGVVWVMMLRRVGIRTFDLHEALGADGLVATSCPVQIGWII